MQRQTEGEAVGENIATIPKINKRGDERRLKGRDLLGLCLGELKVHTFP